MFYRQIDGRAPPLTLRSVFSVCCFFLSLCYFAICTIQRFSRVYLQATNYVLLSCWFAVQQFDIQFSNVPSGAVCLFTSLDHFALGPDVLKVYFSFFF